MQLPCCIIQSINAVRGLIQTQKLQVPVYKKRTKYWSKSTGEAAPMEDMDR